MKHQSIKISGRVEFPALMIKEENQVTTEGARKIIQAMASSDLIRVTNILLLSDYPGNIPDTDVVFSDIAPFVTYQGHVGSFDSVPGGAVNEDLRLYISSGSLIEFTAILTVPPAKAVGRKVNAAVMVMGGDANSSVSATDQYTPTGQEVVFAIAQFDEIIKDGANPLVLVWYTKLT